MNKQNKMNDIQSNELAMLVNAQIRIQFLIIYQVTILEANYQYFIKQQQLFMKGKDSFRKHQNIYNQLQICQQIFIYTCKRALERNENIEGIEREITAFNDRMQERLDRDFYLSGLESKSLKRKWATDGSSLNFSPAKQKLKQLKLQHNPYNAFETNNIFASNILNQVQTNQQENVQNEKHYYHIVRNGGKCTAIYCTEIEGLKGISKAEVLTETYEHFAKMHKIQLDQESDQDILAELNEKHKVISFVSREIKKAEFEVVYARKTVFLKNPSVLQKHLKELQEFMKSEEKRFFCATCAKSQINCDLKSFLQISQSKDKDIVNKSDYTPALLANRLNRNQLENYLLNSRSQCKLNNSMNGTIEQEQNEQQFTSPSHRSKSTIKFKDAKLTSPKSAKFKTLRHQDSAELYLNLKQKHKDKPETNIQVDLASPNSKCLCHCNSFSLKENNQFQELKEIESDRTSPKCLFHRKVLDSYSINKNRFSHQQTSQNNDQDSECNEEKKSLFLNSILTDNTNTVIGKDQQVSAIQSPFFNLNKFSLFKESIQKQLSTKKSAHKLENSDYCVLCQAISAIGKNEESEKKINIGIIEQVMEPDWDIRNDEDDKNSPSIICLNATKKVSVTSTINKANVLSKPLYISGYQEDKESMKKFENTLTVKSKKQSKSQLQGILKKNSEHTNKNKQLSISNGSIKQ